MNTQLGPQAWAIPDYEEYDYEQEWAGRGIENEAERRLVADWVEPGDCLELGGGFGRLTSILERRGNRVFMVDTSRRNIRKASARLARTSLVRASLGTIPFADGSFSSVVVVRVLHHVPKLRQTLDEVVRVARNGGCVIIGVPNTSGSSVKENALVARGPQGHAIYAAPLSAYSHPNMKRIGIRGLGLFDNAIGKTLSGARFLTSLDLATSALWAVKPQVFIKFRVVGVRAGGAPVTLPSLN